MVDRTGGLDGVVAAETVLSHVDGERGKLIIRGVPLDLLVVRGFEPAVDLLWDGFVASDPTGPDLRERVGLARERAFDQLPTGFQR